MLYAKGEDFDKRVKWKVLGEWSGPNARYGWGVTFDPRYTLCRGVSETSKGHKFLSIGCGLGIVESFIPHNIPHVGIDLDESKLEEARWIDPWGVFIKSNATRLPFRDSYFSSVLMLAIIEVLQEDGRRQMIDEVDRVLIGGGHGFILTPNRDCKYYVDSNKLSRRDLSTLMDDHNYTLMTYSLPDDETEVVWLGVDFEANK